MEFIKNDLIDEVLKRYFQTFAITLDTAEFVPAKYGKKIHKFIFKNMRQKFREIKRVYKKQKQEAGVKGGEADEACAASPPPAVAQFVKA